MEMEGGRGGREQGEGEGGGETGERRKGGNLRREKGGRVKESNVCSNSFSAGLIYIIIWTLQEQFLVTFESSLPACLQLRQPLLQWHCVFVVKYDGVT